MKKKLLTLALALALGLSLAACSGPTGGAASTPPDAASTPPGAANSAVPAPTGGATPSAAAGDDWAYLQEKGELVIGYTVFEPMNYTDESGAFVGFETEFATAVCEKLGVKPVFQEINWETKLLELDAKNIDCIWNGMTITDDLKENISVSDPYIKNMQVVVVKSDNAGKYTDTASLAGATVCAEIGSAGEAAIQGDADLAKAAYVGVSKQTDGLLEVKAGTSDAVVLDYVLAGATIGEGTDFADLMAVPGVELSVEEYGVGFRKGSAVTARVNAAMQELIADGTLNTIAEKYGLAGQLIANQK